MQSTTTTHISPSTEKFTNSAAITPRINSRWDTVTTVHTLAATSVLGLGAAILTMRKGTKAHRVLGRVWTGAMLTTCVSSFGLRSDDGKLSIIHGLSVLTMYSIGAGIYHIRHKNVLKHTAYMRGAYVFTIVAGALAVFTPHRRVHDQLFGKPVSVPDASAASAALL